MSRIGKLPINIPNDVDLNYNGSFVLVKGKFGTLMTKIPNTVEVKQMNQVVQVNLKEQTRSFRALHGLYRTLINNMIIGVSEQFRITLILKGIGYRAILQNNLIILNVGYSHPITISIPEQIAIEIKQNTIIELKSCNKELLGLFASNIRSWRPPEPYKGKGILYQNEIILRKAGKSGK